MKRFIVCLMLGLSSCAGGDLPAADAYEPRPVVRRPTMWVLRVAGVKQPFLIPIWLGKQFSLRPGQLVSAETARLLAIELGARYTNEQLEQLERIGN